MITTQGVQYQVVCDYCGARHQHAGDLGDAITAAQADGWRVGNFILHFDHVGRPAVCPACVATWARERFRNWSPGVN